MNYVLLQVLKLHSIESVKVDGCKGGSIWKDCHNRFKTSTHAQARTLVMSNVRMMGLNLAETNILICLV